MDSCPINILIMIRKVRYPILQRYLRFIRHVLEYHVCCDMAQGTRRREDTT